MADQVRKDLGYEKQMEKLPLHTEQVSAGKQPRKGLQELIPEFRTIEQVPPLLDRREPLYQHFIEQIKSIKVEFVKKKHVNVCVDMLC